MQRASKAQHGRWETRRRWALSDAEVNQYLGCSGDHRTAWPYMAQVCRIERERLHVRTGRVIDREVEVTHAITSRPADQTDAAALLRANRAHWRMGIAAAGWAMWCWGRMPA